MAMSPPVIESNSQHETAAWNELRPVLHAEVNRLPDKYRMPVILSYLEGKTNEEVAELLHWPVGTVKGRLSRARDMLRSRLMRRGLCLSAAFLVTALAEGRVFAEVVPADLVQRTVRLVVRFGPRSAAPAAGSTTEPPSVDGDLPIPVETLAKASRRYRRRGIRAVGWPVVAVGIVSIMAGICVAAVGSGGFSNIRTALSALIPTPQVKAASSGGCH
jgi:hypothetical protein